MVASKNCCDHWTVGHLYRWGSSLIIVVDVETKYPISSDLYPCGSSRELRMTYIDFDEYTNKICIRHANLTLMEFRACGYTIDFLA